MAILPCFEVKSQLVRRNIKIFILLDLLFFYLCRAGHNSGLTPKDRLIYLLVGPFDDLFYVLTWLGNSTWLFNQY